MADLECLVAVVEELDVKTAARGDEGLARKDVDLPRSDGGLSWRNGTNQKNLVETKMETNEGKDTTRKSRAQFLPHCLDQASDTQRAESLKERRTRKETTGAPEDQFGE
jgi:hypothetical protein